MDGSGQNELLYSINNNTVTGATGIDQYVNNPFGNVMGTLANEPLNYSFAPFK